MATVYQNPSRPMKNSNVQKSRIKNTTSHQPQPPTITNKSKEIKKRFGNNSSQNSMYKPSSILKKKPFEQPLYDNFNQNVADWYQPSDLQPAKSRQFYSPIHIPPRLRTLITPPGLEPYRNRYDLRRLNSPLPGIDDWYTPPVRLDTWGLDPIDHHLNTNLNLIRRYPSPLSQYGLGSALQKQKKSYIVVPRLANFVSPPVSRGSASFTLPSRRMSPIYAPDSQYRYLERIDSFTSPRFHREPTDYAYLRRNEAFANRYIEDFIGKTIEDQLIPDILLEIIGELDQESKRQGGRSYKTEVDRYYTQLNQRMHQEETNNTDLYSTEWTREIDHQDNPTIRTAPQLRYHDLPSDVQGRLLADLNQELIDYEIKNMMTDVSGQTISNRSQTVSVRHDANHDSTNIVKHQVQYNAVEKTAQNKLLDTICLDELILRYVKQTGSVVDVDDISRLLDGNILGNLIHQYQDIDENRSRTLDNYATRKFHLNTFMNVTMDLLLTELSASLIEDMKDLDEQEHKTLF